MHWKLPLVLLFVALLPLETHAQRLFPVKINNRWGLINQNGRLVQEATYDAIGEFKHFGCAIMQQKGLIGLLDANGKVLLQPIFDDLKVLDSNLVAVMQGNQWRVLNYAGQTVLAPGYERVRVMQHGLLAYLQKKQWGLVSSQGFTILPPEFDNLELYSEGYILTEKNKLLGLATTAGLEVLPPRAQAIDLLNDSLVVFKANHKWGAVDATGFELIPPEYDSFDPISPHYIILMAGGQQSLYSAPCKRVFKKSNYTDFLPFSPRYVVGRKDKKLGLLDWCGMEVLPPAYEEIQPLGEAAFRVLQDGRWGVVSKDGASVVAASFQYISPLSNGACVVKRDDKFGILHVGGTLLLEPLYQKLDWDGETARAYLQPEGGKEELLLFGWQTDGTLVQKDHFANHHAITVRGKNATSKASDEPSPYLTDYQINGFEWFFETASGKWGLRNSSTGEIQISPTFDQIRVERDLGFTLAGIRQRHDYDFERTTFRHEMAYCVVVNELGMPVTELELLDVRFEDFYQNAAVARIVLTNGKHGLLARNGVIARKDATYIGPFANGYAKAAFAGQLSGSRQAACPVEKLSEYLRALATPVYRVDYTQYDQLFEQEAMLTCEGCVWGYMDSLGQIKVTPQFDFAEDMASQTGIVKQKGKWGMVNTSGQLIIPCQYDQIELLRAEGRPVARLYVEEPRFGLIDTLGQLAVGALYEEIGAFSEGRLAVASDGRWGYVNRNGLEVIPCRFRVANDFSEGKAAVCLGNNWGFIDSNGDTQIPFEFSRVGNYKQGRAWVRTHEGVGYIDRRGNFIIPSIFQKAFDFEQGVARVVMDNKYGLIDTSGAFILRPKYQDIGQYNSLGLAIASYGTRDLAYGIVNKTGQLITTQDYLEIREFSEGFAAVKTTGGYGFIDTNGKLVVDGQYSKVGDFHEGLAMVQKQGKCGYINTQGRVVIPCEYSHCLDFNGGKAVVYQGIRNAGIVDKNGQVLIEPSLDRLLDFQEDRGLMRDENYRFYYITEQSTLYDGYYDQASAFKHGVAVVQINGKWGIINRKGIEIIPPKYGLISDFNNGYAKVRIEGYNGISTLDGELLAQPQYEFIHYAGNGIFRVEQGDKIGYLDSSGEWIWELND